MIPKVDLKAKAKLTEASSRAFPLAFDVTWSSEEILDYLDVEKSARYTPTTTQTFCNIYAYDYARAFGAWLPRVWWKDKNLNEQKFEVVKYGETVVELNVNSLYKWFPKYSKEFGWREITSFKEAQELANSGKCVLMMAANKVASRSGHIVAVVQETKEHKATVKGNKFIPLQSNAGRTNKKYFSSEWWLNHEPIKIYVYDGGN